jgi:hypothetical protein
MFQVRRSLIALCPPLRPLRTFCWVSWSFDNVKQRNKLCGWGGSLHVISA